MASLKIWMNERLPSEGFNCFTGRLAYSQDTSLFACGFASPDQQLKMKSSKTFCLDATHGISNGLSDILYTLIIRENSIGRGWPVAYMITNDHSTGPIVEWLQHLRDSRLLVDPEQFTIDCCQAEVNAITNTFDAETTRIQFCIFHVTQAWNKHLASVSVSGNTPAENRALRGEMTNFLQTIVYEEDLDQFHHKIVAFQEEYADQVKFMDYFVKNWCTEDRFKVWSRSYKERQFSHMLTNNYIESWHNQLKNVFLGRVRNKRLDKLVFVLVNDVEYYLTQEFERVLQGNGAMSPFFKQQRIREMEAEEVDEQVRERMISSPSNVDSNDNFRYQVSSFVENSTISYDIEVNNENLIMSCTCYDYDRRRQPCKYMYLLTLHTNFSLHMSSSHSDNTGDLPPVVPVENGLSSNTPSEANPNLAKVKHCIDINKTMNHACSDFLKLASYMTEEEATRMLDYHKRSLQFAQEMKDKYHTHFRRSNTQL